MYTEFENEIRNYKVASFTTISKEEYQQLLNEKYEGFITVEGRPFNVMVIVPHECSICGKKFYNRAANMLGNAEELHHQCFVTLTGGDSESDKVRKKRLAEIERIKGKLCEEGKLNFAL
ncbi:hypothetical protein CUC43_12515 [Bacillus thuringiensis LM1212]|uniref:hypothetical protein n=1 Tax=Bacillus cereus group TaxID=86661 RepID=UPI00041EF710|nr:MULTISPECIES: hypothetical protein [Bacillus cereus group]AXY07617.1 hypothetical protein CUC43_12515 [Bacillus thuringiensis LM1212]QDF25994.1 hypothetical protein FJR70_24850 [Bacillus tropicus]QUG93933.1 hypothetical protein HCM98_02780 [Bacillus tropicus]